MGNVLRTHYEGTPDDQTIYPINPSSDYPLGDPHHTGLRVICTATTQESFVMQLRSNMPPHIGNVYWRTQGRPCESVYVPLYLGMLEFPTPYTVGIPSRYNKLPLSDRYYDPDSAYWVFNRMETLVDLDYLVKKPLVRDFWDDVEGTEFALQDEIEKTARKMYEGKNYHGEDRYFADWFLTRYSQSLALDAYYKALGFIDEFEP